MPELLSGADEETPAVARPAAGVSSRSPGAGFAAVGRWARSHALALTGTPLAAIVLFTLYLHQARTAPLNGDGAGNALQAWDMLHGNLLLSHWSVSDVSFYFTELPEYMLVEAVHGLNGDVVHIAAALTYTLAVLLACWLARGRARGAEAAVRVLIVLVVMLAAPARGTGVVIELDSPDHFGTAVPLLVFFLALERLPRRRFTPVLLFLLLVWAGSSDTTAIFLGGGALAVICATRLWQGKGRRRYEASLLAVAVLAAGVAIEVPRVIARLGGFTMHRPDMAFNAAADMPNAVWQSVSAFLELFGANFFGLSVAGPSSGGAGVPGETVFALLHLFGAGLVVAALIKTVRRLRDGGREDAGGDGTGGVGSGGDEGGGTGRDRIAELLTVGILLNLAALVFSTQYRGWAREIAAVLPLAAVVAARVLAGRMTHRKHVALLGAFATVFAAVLAYHATGPSQPPYAHRVEAWLKQHGYTSGIGGYWTSHSITVGSGGAIQVSPVNTGPAGIQAYDWESKSTWYDPRQRSANFLVVDLANPSALQYARPQQAIKQFGPPARVVPIGGWEVMIWDKNLLADLPGSN
ncbi:hypothetical protein KGA66_05335 [Actinocrinis puniceicyclus]|uniref:Uncharacterized protein n=1 Tax=Actinocrinis puniceicyclus TaxID=977794 RepID=A0A8J7WHR8_9ACTN|nr:hypothetical protein [Actinocrinis puniceicyclus]MBS2962458.1 hypothetical protein [Actinocrinis puniceicyclus]